MPEIHPGQAHSPDPLAVAWISYNDYQKLVAPQSIVEQPALQKTAKPVPGAPLIPDPNASVKPGEGGRDLDPPRTVESGPKPSLGASAGGNDLTSRGREGAVDAPPSSALPLPDGRGSSAERPKPAEMTPVTPKPVDSSVAVAPLPSVVHGDLAAPPAVKPPDKPGAPAPAPEVLKPDLQLALVLPGREDDPLTHVDKNDPSKPVTAGHDPGAQVPSATQRSASVGDGAGRGQGGEGQAHADGKRPGEPNARPSGSPRAESESPPVSLAPHAVDIPVHAGSVVACEGMEVRPVVPRETVAMRFSFPANPVARLTFNHRGEVVNVKLLRSTGTADWDGPIIAALYAWTAVGPKLDEIKDRAFLDVHLLLGGSDD